MFLFFAANVFAQGYRISGRIVDSEGPVVGATVMEVGTSIGISTDVDGAYALTVSGPDAVIEVSCLGYEAQTFKASAVPASVSLGTNAQFLQDAVVIGYGTMAKKDLTGAVSVLGQEELRTCRSPTSIQCSRERFPALPSLPLRVHQVPAVWHTSGVSAPSEARPHLCT